jgi:periplasmic divalent cation tolerance protein
MKNICIMYVPVSNRKEGMRIAETLIGEKLAACANIYPGVTSIYRWENKICRETEHVLFMKTRKALFAKAMRRVKELHSYKCPCITAIPVTGANKEYVEWIMAETSRGKSK